MKGDEPETLLSDHDPAKLLPFSKRFLPEDPEVIDLGRQFMRNGFTAANDEFRDIDQRDGGGWGDAD